MTSFPDQTVEKAWTSSFLSELPSASARDLLARVYRMDVAAGHVIYPELPKPERGFTALVLSGLVRVYVTSPKGRRMTTRYARTGEVIGLPSLLLGGAPVGVDAITPASLLQLDVPTVVRMTSTNASFAAAVARELARQLIRVEALLAGNVFGTVRERVARHLLALAAPQGELQVAVVSQQELADSIGSVREVIGRVLIQFRDEGHVRRDRTQIVILDPEALARVAEGRGSDVVTGPDPSRAGD
ncbi:MAG: Crp/Fnr family transcriptional regulator [Thermoleophilaceae bacterium]